MKDQPTKPIAPTPIVIEQHYAPAFYAALWGVSESTVTKWFRDLPGVLKLSKESRNGKRSRQELRIPWTIAQQEYEERSR